LGEASSVFARAGGLGCTGGGGLGARWRQLPPALLFSTSICGQKLEQWVCLFLRTSQAIVLAFWFGVLWVGAAAWPLSWVRPAGNAVAALRLKPEIPFVKPKIPSKDGTANLSR